MLRALHGLSCCRSQCLYPKHSLSECGVVKESLGSAKISSQLEPNGVLRSDSKRPDRLSLVPWKWAQSLVWAITCTYTYAQSHLALVGIEELSIYHKRNLYQELDSVYLLVSLAFETSRAFGWLQPFFTDLGKWVEEPRAYILLCFSMWLLKFSGVTWQPYWGLCLRLFALLYLCVGGVFWHCFVFVLLLLLSSSLKIIIVIVNYCYL